jgi:hypothetical protein
LYLQAGIPKAIRQLVSKLAECGWLFNKVKNYVESRSADKTFGLVGQVSLWNVVVIQLNVVYFANHVSNITTVDFLMAATFRKIYST